MPPVILPNAEGWYMEISGYSEKNRALRKKIGGKIDPQNLFLESCE